MLTFEQMLVRLLLALALGALMGLERELVGKEAGVRTSLTVSGGAAIFSMVGLTLPELTCTSASGANFAVIANIVIGIGFLGAGIIVKTEERVHGLTTAAVVWATAAIGMLAGIGLFKFAVVSAVLLAGLLYALRKAGIVEIIELGSNKISGRKTKKS